MFDQDPYLVALSWALPLLMVAGAAAGPALGDWLEARLCKGCDECELGRW